MLTRFKTPGMAKDFCKYPVIVGCVIGGLILISCIWCLIRCCMCGIACCSCCCGGCGGRKTKKHRHQVEFVPAQPPPMYQPPVYREEPQFAYTTDQNGKVNGDSLPVMPTWETMKVEVKEEVEMNYVNNDEYKRKPPSPGMGGGEYGHASQRVGLATPTPDPYALYPSRVLSPGPMPAPIPVNPTGQKLGFNSRGPSPGPHQYEDRDPIQANYGYHERQGPRLGNHAAPPRNPYDLPYQEEPHNVMPQGQQYGTNADYYNTGPEPQRIDNSTGIGGSGGYAAYSPSRTAPHAHGQAPPHSNGQSMYPSDDRPYDYDDPHRRKQDPWSAL